MIFSRQYLIELFGRFCKERLVARYQFGVGRYDSISTDQMANYGCNPFIETEDDYKVKFGGFLESELWETGFCVHSELNRIYDGDFKGQRPDLTIHSCDGEPWLDDARRKASVRCLIELKGANIRDPYHEFRKRRGNTVFKDVEKLASYTDTSRKVVRCLVFLDERNLVGKPNGKISEEEATELVCSLKNRARELSIMILSNNSCLMVV